MASERITVHNLADLKNTSDDAIPNYLNSLKFTQSNSLIDTRLALGWTAFIVAAACFGWDYQWGFETTKWATAAAVLLYSILNGALTLWIWLVEQGTVYEGTAPSGEKIKIATLTRKNVPTYHLRVTVTPKSGPPTALVLAESFTQWFDAAGHFVPVPFQEVLATGVPLIGRLDPRRIRSKTQDLLRSDPSALDALLAAAEPGEAAAAAASPAVNASGAEPTPKKGGKRRKA